MTIDEAIEHAIEVSNNTSCSECAQNHKQLALWLTQLKEYQQKEKYKELLIGSVIIFTIIFLAV